MENSKTLWQVRFGKLVQAEDGPIISGCEHQITGCSADIPKAILEKCVPHRIGVGADDVGSDWWPWRDQGGLVLRTVFANGKWYWVAGRVRSRSEAGESKPGRMYTEAYYLVHPIEKDSDVDILPDFWQLPDMLQAKPVTAPSVFTLPNRPVEPAPYELGAWEEWEKNVERILLHLLTGVPFVTTDSDQEPDEFFRLALLVLACLPRAIRWRVAIGSGLCTIGRQIGIGHGAKSRGNDTVSPQPKDQMDKVAQKYWSMLKNELAGKSTFAELLDGVKSAFPAYSSWDKEEIPLETPWPDAINCLRADVAAIIELYNLNRWLRESPGGREPVMARFGKKDRRDVVELLLRSLENSDRALPLLNQPDVRQWESDWPAIAKEDWITAGKEELPDRAQVFMVLFRYWEADADILVRFIDIEPEIPREFEDDAKRILDDQLEEMLNKPGASLEEMLNKPGASHEFVKACGDTQANHWPAWFRQWRNSKRELLLLIGCANKLATPDSLETWQGKEVDAVNAIFESRSPEIADFDKLLSLPSYPQLRHVVEQLGNMAWQHQLYAVSLLLLEKAGRLDQGARQVDSLWDKAKQDDRSQLLKSALHFGSEMAWPECLLQVVVPRWHKINFKTREIKLKYQEQIAQKVGGKYAKFLIGWTSDDPSTGSLPEVGKRLLKEAMNTRQDLVDELFHVCTSIPDEELIKVLREWAFSDEADLSQVPEELKFLRDLHSDKPIIEVPSLDFPRAFQLQQVAGVEVASGRQNDFVKQAIQDLGKFRACLATGTIQASDQLDDVLAKVLEDVLRDPPRRQSWQQLLHQAGFQVKKAPWRLVCTEGQKPRELSSGEEKIVSKLIRPELDLYLFSGWPISKAVIVHFTKEFGEESIKHSRIDGFWLKEIISETSGQGAARQQMRRLVDCAHNNRLQSFGHFLASHLLARELRLSTGKATGSSVKHRKKSVFQLIIPVIIGIVVVATVLTASFVMNNGDFDELQQRLSSATSVWFGVGLTCGVGVFAAIVGWLLQRRKAARGRSNDPWRELRHKAERAARLKEADYCSDVKISYQKLSHEDLKISVEKHNNAAGRVDNPHAQMQ